MIELIRANLIAQTIYDANNTCMTVKECAEYLGVHPKTVTNQLHGGKITGTLIGRVWSIPKLQFLDEIIKENNTLVQALQRAIEVETPRKLTKKKHIELLAKKMANGHTLTKKELEFLNQEP